MALALSVLLTVAACSVPDRPPRLDGRLPSDADAWLAPATTRLSAPVAGVWVHEIHTARGPWALYLAEIDATRCELALQVVQAEARERGERGRERVSEMARRSAEPILVAVNGDFFTPEGQPLGPERVDGRVTSARSRPGLTWRDGSVDRLEIRSTAEPAGVSGRGSPPDFVEMIGGFPELLDQGRRVGDLGITTNPGFAATRHPRTAVGWDPQRRRLWLVVVDGRQPGVSEGMSLPELTELLEALGATEALNLDGGGSSVMLVGTRIINQPADATGERAVVNGLALTYNPAGCSRG